MYPPISQESGFAWPNVEAPTQSAYVPGGPIEGGGAKLGAPCGLSWPIEMSYFPVNGFNPGGGGRPEPGLVVFEGVEIVPAGIEYHGDEGTGLLLSASVNF